MRNVLKFRRSGTTSPLALTPTLRCLYTSISRPGAPVAEIYRISATNRPRTGPPTPVFTLSRVVPGPPGWYIWLRKVRQKAVQAWLGQRSRAETERYVT